MGAHIHIEHGTIQIVAGVLFGDHRLLDGVHTANRGAVGIVTTVQIPGAHALKPGNFLGFLVIGWADEMPAVRTRGGQNPLHLQRGNHVGMLGVIVGVEFRWIERLESGSQHYRPHIEIDGLFLLIEIHRIGGTKFNAGATFLFLDVNARIALNGVFQGNSLGIFNVRCFALDQPRIVDINGLLGAFIGAGAAGNAFILVDIAGLLENLHLEIPGVPGNIFNFGKCD